MPSFLKRHPALALLIVSMTIGLVILVPVMTGVAPSALTQLGAVSASAAGFILAGVEGGWAAVRELARRVLIWRVGLGWWALALLHMPPSKGNRRRKLLFP